MNDDSFKEFLENNNFNGHDIITDIFCNKFDQEIQDLEKNYNQVIDFNTFSDGLVCIIDSALNVLFAFCRIYASLNIYDASLESAKDDTKEIFNTTSSVFDEKNIKGNLTIMIKKLYTNTPDEFSFVILKCEDNDTESQLSEQEPEHNFKFTGADSHSSLDE